MAYVTKDEVKKYLGVNWSAGLDTFVDTLIDAAAEFVDGFTGRTFEAPDPDSDVTRYFNGNGRERLPIEDLRSITSLTVDGVALVQNTDYYLYPLNAAADGEPYTSIELVQPETSFANNNPRSGHTIPYVFEELQRSVVVVGKWGYSATAPSDIKVAVMKLVGGIIKENIGDSDLREVTEETLGEYSTSFAKIKDIANAIGIPALLGGYQKGKVTGASKVIQVS